MLILLSFIQYRFELAGVDYLTCMAEHKNVEKLVTISRRSVNVWKTWQTAFHVPGSI